MLLQEVKSLPALTLLSYFLLSFLSFGDGEGGWVDLNGKEKDAGQSSLGPE